ncbi:sugar kinase [Vibrio mexicanus]|uniref:sugar kinase n=1 Tax=Vibrio mexicanus TaxID=1004326 RepID=UPI00063C7894|nr:sugar kinase [Vibrio mexicanus]
MKTIQRVAIIGECMVELSKPPQPEGETATPNCSLSQGFGGDTLNTAIYLSRMTQSAGLETCYITGLGVDPFSRQMLEAWREEGIDTQGVYQLADRVPGMYAIETDESGERQFYYWRNESAARFWLEAIDTETVMNTLSSCQLIYLSGISLAILPEDSRARLMTFLAECRDQGAVIAFDNNYRPRLWEAPEVAQHWYQNMLALTDIAFLTFEDEQLLWEDETEQQAIQRTLESGVGEIVIKRGAQACWIVYDGQQIEVAAQKVANVVDTTAAGDSFSAGYLAKRVLGESPTEAGHSGHQLAATVIQHRGAIIPKTAMP